MKSYFFNVGMEFLQQREGVIYMKKGLTTITLGFLHPSAFTFKITFGDSNMDVVSGKEEIQSFIALDLH